MPASLEITGCLRGVRIPVHALRSDSIVVYLSTIAGLVITRRYRLVTRINITTSAFGQGVITKSFSLYLICRKNIFFVVFLNIFLDFLVALQLLFQSIFNISFSLLSSKHSNKKAAASTFSFSEYCSNILFTSSLDIRLYPKNSFTSS